MNTIPVCCLMTGVLGVLFYPLQVFGNMALSLIVIVSLGKQLYMYFSFTFTGANCQYWRSIQDDAIPKKNGKLKEHQVVTRWRLRVKRVRFSVPGMDSPSTFCTSSPTCTSKISYSPGLGCSKPHYANPGLARVCTFFVR